MPATPTIAALTPAVIDRYFDRGAITRGRQYAVAQRVSLQRTDAGLIRAAVAGSGRQQYQVLLEWEQRHGGVVISDRCTCPLGGACKHVVATIVVAQGATGARPSGDPAWRRALAVALGRPDEASDPSLVPLALEVSVQRSAPTRYQPAPVLQATLRPLRLGRNGRWIRSNVGWRDLRPPVSYHLRDVIPGHLAVLAGMLAGARGLYYNEPAAIPLDAFGRDLWFHLARAVQAGITLVGPSGAPEEVVLAPEPGRITLDLTADDAGTVAVSTRLLVPDEPVALDPDDVRLLGTPTHGLVHRAAGATHLVPLAEPVPAGLAGLLVAPPLVVPPDDVDDLLTSYEPLLSRLAPVGSSDGSVTIAVTEFDTLVLVVDRLTPDEAEVSWVVRYRHGARVIDQPFTEAAPFRDTTTERRAVAAVELPDHRPAQLQGPDGAPRSWRIRGRDAVVLLTEVVPWLVDAGVVAVELRGDLPDLQPTASDPLIALTVEDRPDGPAPGNDWFDLGVEVSVDGEIVPFATLFTALANDDDVLVLASGSWLRLDRPELAALRGLIDEARALADPDRTGTLRISSFQAGWFEELAALGVIRRQSERWAEHTARLSALSVPEPVPPPAGLAATLRPYQQEGFDWLVFLHRHGLGGILADDMGLGKTVQTLALCLHVLEQNPSSRFLVIAPTSVVENWHREADRFAADLDVCAVRETAARRGTTLADEIGSAHLVVTSYALFRLEFDDYSSLDWDLLLLDEAQYVKNHQGKTYQCVRRLDVATKVAITGTPMENSLMDLWALLSITAPGLFPDPKRFAEVYRRPIESGSSPELLATLRRRMAPLLRRRTKDAVLTELPPKTEQIVEVELSPRHSRIYQRQLQRQRQKVLGLVGDVQRHRFEIFKSLTLLRQLSLDPALVDPAHDGVGSAKLDRLEADLAQVVAEGHRALVFSQFTRYLARVRTRLDDAGIPHAYLDGRTRKRSEAIASFKEGDVPVFVISLKAGGVGLNLTEADYCFILDPWWNPAVEDQAVDRTHRIGQVNPVVVYRYVAEGTIEEKVMALKARKAALFDEVIDADGALAGALTEDDIRGLLDLG